MVQNEETVHLCVKFLEQLSLKKQLTLQWSINTWTVSVVCHSKQQIFYICLDSHYIGFQSIQVVRLAAGSLWLTHLATMPSYLFPSLSTCGVDLTSHLQSYSASWSCPTLQKCFHISWVLGWRLRERDPEEMYTRTLALTSSPVSCAWESFWTGVAECTVCPYTSSIVIHQYSDSTMPRVEIHGKSCHEDNKWTLHRSRESHLWC